MNWQGVEDLVAGERAGATIAVAVRRLGNGPSWQIRDDRVFSAASTIKVAILVALYQEIDAGRLDLDDRFAATPAQTVPGSGVLAWMQPGLTLTLADFAYLMIAISDNTASNVVLGAVGIERVRATIAALGMTHSTLNRPFLGRPPGPGAPDNLTTARDLVTLLAAIAEERAASPAACARMLATLRLQQDRDRLARSLPDDAPFAGKSGSLPRLTHDCGLLDSAGGPLAVAVLTEGIDDPYRAEALIGQIGQTLIGGER